MSKLSDKRGSSIDFVPSDKPAELAPAKTVRPTSKQTIEVGRKAMGRIREVCMTHGMSFQEFAVIALSDRLRLFGEPSIEDLEAAE